VIIKLNVVKEFWKKESRFWGTKANYYRRTKRTKSNLQATDQFLSEEDMKKVDAEAHKRLASVMEEEGTNSLY